MIFLALLLAFILMLPAAAFLARVCSPKPPSDGTPGPWCLSCRYSLAGIPETAPCPECGRAERVDRRAPSSDAALCLIAVFVAAIVSHAGAYAAWAVTSMAGSDVAIVGVVLMLELPFITGAAATLAFRIRGRFLIVCILALILPHAILDTLLGVTEILSPSKGEYASLERLFIPAPGLLATPIVFILFALTSSAWIAIARRRARQTS